MKRQSKRLGVVAMLVVLGVGAGCEVEQGTMLEIVAVPAPAQGTCVVDFQGELVSPFGFYDPTLRDGFRLSLTMRNHMVEQTFDQITGPSNDNLRPSANNVTLLGFETCFYLENDPNLTVNQLGEKGDGLVDCATLPESQQAFVVSQAVVPAGDTLGGTTIEVLTHEDLKGLFGANFNPAAIPEFGRYFEDYDGDGLLGQQEPIRFSKGSEDPANPNRSPAWGTYPDTRDARIILQLRAIGKLQTGWRVSSQWFHYPIDLSIGTVVTICGDLNLVQCTNACGDPTDTCNHAFAGDPYAARACALESPGSCGGVCAISGFSCAPYAYSGSVASFATSCLASQGVNPPLCVQVDGCLLGGSPP